MFMAEDAGSDCQDRMDGPDPAAERAPSPVGLPAAVRDHLGSQLQAAYRTLTSTPLPQRFRELIAQLDDALEAPAANAVAFRHGLMEALPRLRAFALSLARDEVRADDLVQETLLKAWAKRQRFEAGSNLLAWLCTILRNQFYTEIRKRKREVEDTDGVMAAQLTTAAGQEHSSDLQAAFRHMDKLSPRIREALLLVGAQGLTYEEAAAVMGCEVGTAKSRVSRARSFLAGSLGLETLR